MPRWLKYCFLAFGMLLVGYAWLFFPKAPETISPITQDDTQGPVSSVSRLYTIAAIDAETLREEMRVAALVDYLNEWLRPHDIGIQVHVSKDYESARALFRAKAVDIFYDSPASVSIFNREFGLDSVLIRHRDGVDHYHGVIFTLDESSIQTIEDLRGRILAVESILSTSAYFLPLDQIAEAGVPLSGLTSFQDPIQADTLNLILSEQESVSLMWVLDRRTDAGVMKNTRFDALDPAVRARLRVIARTRDVPREIFSFSQQINPIDRRLLIDAFRHANQTPKGRAALQSFQQTLGFSLIEESAELACYLDRMITRDLPFRAQ